MVSAGFAHVLLPLALLSPKVALFSIVALSLLLMLIGPKGIREVWWISGGAILLIALGLIPIRLAGQAVAKGSDVYLFLIGMMVLSELAREHGIFDWLASLAVRGASGSCSRLFLAIYAAGTVVTIFMSNDATAVVLTPAILAAVRKAKVSPIPYLFVCALIANAASFVLPISNPANLVVFHSGMPPLRQWLIDFGVPSLASIAVTVLVMRILFRHDLGQRIPSAVEGKVEQVKLSKNGRLVMAGLALMTAVLLTASAMNRDLGLPTCLAALAITAIVSLKSRSNPIALFREISWPTLLLVASLFILVDAVESQGALRMTQQWLTYAAGLGQYTGPALVGFVVGIANNIVNNLPLGLIAGATIHSAAASKLMANSILIGVDLGPNLSVTGSLATILWLLAIRKDSDANPGEKNLDITFWKFLKTGAIAMPAALFAALGAAILIHLLSA